MSRVRASNKSIQEWTEELLRPDETRALARRIELREHVRYCEDKYGLPSSDIHEAIEDGRLDETHEVTRWIMDYELLQWIEERSAG